MRLSSAIQLIAAIVFASSACAAEVKTATYLGTYTWRSGGDWFGGFSALHLSDNGHSMIVLSDRANIAQANIDRDGDQITDVTVEDRWPLRSSRGRILTGRAGDAEGIAIAPDGTIYISFEGVHRIARYHSPDDNARVLPRPKEFDALDRNGSFEALAIDGRGWLYTMTERSRTMDGDIPVYRWDGQIWTTPFVLPQRGKFLPVAADFDTEGRLYVLERSLSLIGFRSRLRRWEVIGDEVRAEETLLETSTGKHDNLEGLSVWRDDLGRLRATMVSDDNFMVLQSTELVEYLLPN
ncbi:MAG: esterase-like activity of phytase family protein [Ruegeria sp.]